MFTISVEEEEAVIVTHEIQSKFAEEQLREITSSIKTGILREFGLQLLGVVLIRSGLVDPGGRSKKRRRAAPESCMSLPGLPANLVSIVAIAQRSYLRIA